MTPRSRTTCLNDVTASPASRWYESNRCVLTRYIHQSIFYIRLSCPESPGAAVCRCCESRMANCSAGHKSITGGRKQRQTHSHPCSHPLQEIKSPLHKTCMSLDWWRKKGQQEKTHADSLITEQSSCNCLDKKIISSLHFSFMQHPSCVLTSRATCYKMLTVSE